MGRASVILCCCNKTLSCCSRYSVTTLSAKGGKPIHKKGEERREEKKNHMCKLNHLPKLSLAEILKPPPDTDMLFLDMTESLSSSCLGT